MWHHWNLLGPFRGICLAFPTACPRLSLRFSSAFGKLRTAFRDQLGATPPDKSTPEIAHKRFPESSKILPKIDPKMHQIFDRFLHRSFVHFSSNLGPKLGLCWRLFRLLGGDRVRRYRLLCCVGVFFRFFRPPAARWGTPFWAPIWARSSGVPCT